MNEKTNNIMEKISDLSAKFASITYIQVLQNAFAKIMPLFILAGFGTLLNSIVFPFIASGDTLTNLQYMGDFISNSTMNISALLLVAMVAYYLAQERKFEDVHAAMITATASFFAVNPLFFETVLDGTEEAIELSSVVSYSNLGVNGIFTGMIIAFASTEILILLSNNKKLQMNMGENIPPAVGKTFSTLIPLVLTITFFTIISTGLLVFFDTDLTTLINTIIQEPLSMIGSNIWGFVFLYGLSTLMFSFGIHHSVITTPILKPILLINIGENMEAVQAGADAPHIINESFRIVFGQTGGIGSTLPLLIAVLIFSKYKPYRQISKLAIGPGIFQINEPVIFGMPIVFNIPLMIPFLLTPVVSILIGYFVTAIGLIEPLSVLIPWSTPTLVDGFLASGGDWKVVVLQIGIVILQTIIYIPFLKISERTARKQAQS